MRKILAIANKELSAYFNSTVAYIILIIIFSTFNIFFYIIIDENAEATLRDVFRVMEFMFIFIMPILTMKLWAEEKQAGTVEFLKTTPTPVAELVAGKYVGIMVFVSIIIALSGIYFAILEIFATPDIASSLVGYVGLWLEAAFFAAVGLMCSTWTKSQVVAALCSYFILLMLYFGQALEKYASAGLQLIINAVSLMNHSTNLFSGLIVSADLIYFVSGIALSLFIAQKCAESN